MNDVNILIERALHGEKPAVARLISILEREEPGAETIVERVYPHAGKAFYLGITGPPGAGKSTLVDKLVARFRADQLSVGVVAVDPCSPFTGGALLGDRIRMNFKERQGDCFFRSMSAGRVLGGLAQKTKEASWVLAASGREVVLLETVGVGQSELAVLMAADTVVVVLTPESGDTIQAMKAGILEIADIFVINKADRPGAEEIGLTLNTMLDRKAQILGKLPWHPPVYATAANGDVGVDQLYAGIAAHRKYCRESQALEKRREEQYRYELLTALEAEIKKLTSEQIGQRADFPRFAQKMRENRRDPHSVARMVRQKLFAGLGHAGPQGPLDELLRPQDAGGPMEGMGT